MIAAVYPWIKAFHIVAVVAWMAGLLYLPRLFVYHATAPVGSDTSETFKIMEAKLMRVIMAPAAILTWVLGATLLALNPAHLQEGWIYVKLFCVIGLTGMHHAMIGWRRAFAEDRNRRSQRFFRIANEIPTLALIIIAIMVVVQPF